MVGAGNSGRSRGSARADNNQPKSGSNSSRSGAGGGRDGGSRGSGIRNGDVAAMAAVTAAPIWRRQWQRGRPMWAEVIFCKLLTIICITRMAKHKSVLREQAQHR
jgi:hypothetical protein